MKRVFLLMFCLSGWALTSNAQDNKELEIGDTLYFATCRGDQFVFIDLYTKTRWEKTDLTYNKEDGTGFYEYFFKTGDFDINRMPCSYKGKYGTVTAIQVISEEGKAPRTILFVTIEDNVKVAWVEAESAFESGEVEFR